MPFRKQEPNKRHADRVRKADELARQPSCAAADVDEFNYCLPAALAAQLLRARDCEVAPQVCENALVKYIQDCGDPQDPLVRDTLTNNFLTRILMFRGGRYVASGGYPGFKELAPVWSNLNGTMLENSTKLRQWIAEDATARPTPAEPPADPEVRARELRREYEENQRALELAHFEDEKRRYEAMSPEDKAACAAYERAYRDWRREEGRGPEPKMPKCARKQDFDYLEYLVRGVSPFSAEDGFDWDDDDDLEDDDLDSEEDEVDPQPVTENLVAGGRAPWPASSAATSPSSPPSTDGIGSEASGAAAPFSDSTPTPIASAKEASPLVAKTGVWPPSQEKLPVGGTGELERREHGQSERGRPAPAAYEPSTYAKRIVAEYLQQKAEKEK